MTLNQSPLLPLSSLHLQVLEHSHRPLHLRKGDFYSYLSLSSHDSDCGEVSQCTEDKSSTPAPYNIPTYSTPTQGLHSPNPSPELFSCTRHQKANTDSENNFCDLDFKPADSPTLSLPPSPDIRDEETLFAPCTEEVYLGPPLCYSMVLTKKPRRVSLKENWAYLSSMDSDYELKESLAQLPCSKSIDSLQYLSQNGVKSEQEGVNYKDEDFQNCASSMTTHTTQISSSSPPLFEPCYSSFSSVSKLKDDNLSTPPPPPFSMSSGVESERRGEDPYLLCDVAVGEVAAAASVSAPQEERSRNEGPPYLNPRARVAPIDSSAAECLADTKTLESNMGAVMTKISVCGSATNPSKEPAATATRINPKINCSAMREGDREERKGGGGEVDARRVKQEKEEKGRRGRSGSQQEAKTKQVSVPGIRPMRYQRTLYRGP